MIYFNSNGTSWPKPKHVTDIVNQMLIDMPNNTEENSIRAKYSAQNVRKTIGDFFNIPATGVIFTSGATEALNMVIQGLQNKRHIITTAIDHNSVIRPLKTLEKNGAIELTIVKCDKDGFVSPTDIESAMRNDTDALFVNHASNVTGALQDLKAISDIAHKHGAKLIVDASQSAGAVKIDMQELGIDLLVFTGHKCLFGTTGVGCLLFGTDVKLIPFKTGGTGAHSENLFQPEEFPYIHEAGTRNQIGIASLQAGIEYINATGMKNIKQHKKDIYDTIMNGIKDLPNISFYGPDTTANILPVINISIKNFSVTELADILKNKYGITVRAGLHCAPLIHQYIDSLPEGTLRISFSHFLTQDDAQNFIDAIREICNAE